MTAPAPLKEATLSSVDYGEITSPKGRRRWAEHWHTVANDPALSEDVRRWLLDPTIWTIAESADQLGFTDSQRVWILRTPIQARRRPLPHPHRFPPSVDVIARVADRNQPGFAAGMVRLWAGQRGTHVIDPETGNLLPGVLTIDEETGDLVIRDRRAPGTPRPTDTDD